jgi:hypothetical protein
LLALLVLSSLPLQLAPVPLTAHGPCPSEQHEVPDGKLSEEAKLHASLPRLRRVRLSPRASGPLPPTRPEQVHSVRLESLVHEDPRRGLLPRWTAPPEPEAHA